MKNKSQKRFLTNIPLRLLGIVLAILLWLVLNNTQDPVITSSVTVPITYDESGLAEKNMVAISKPTSITIPVKLHRSRLRYLSADDFTVTADLTEVIGDANEAPETSKISIEIAKASSANYIQSWEYPQSQGYVKVVLDTLKTATYLVQFNITKELPEGYQVGTLSSDPSRVTVSGPTSAFSNLAAVKANVDLSALTDGSSITAPLALYDGNNRTLTGSSLTISQETVEVTVGLNQTKEISISIAGSSGAPADGYVVSKVDYTPKLLTISGSKTALANISTISIPSEELDITGASQNQTFEIAIDPYLPDGIALSEGQSGTISVTIELEQLQTKSFQVNVQQFELINTKEKYEYELIEPTLTVTLQALQADLDILDPETLQGTIDVGGLEAGEYINVPVTLTLDSAYTLTDDLIASVRIIDTTTTEASSESTTEMPDSTDSTADMESSESMPQESTSKTETATQESSSPSETLAQ